MDPVGQGEQIALGGINHIIARIVRDGTNWANRLAGVAANANFRIYEMLFDDCCSHISGLFKKTKKANAAALGRPKQGTAPTGGSVVRVATSVGVLF
jgi:hypothetical protein